MRDPRAIPGAAFERRVLAQSWLVSIPALGLASACLLALLELTADQALWLLGLAAVWAAGATPASLLGSRRLLAPISSFLDRHREGTADAQERRAAFAAVIRLPLRMATRVGAIWALSGLAIGAALGLRFATLGLHGAAAILLAGLAAGFAAAHVLLFRIKAVVAPVRELLAAELPDPDERQSLVRAHPLAAKLQVGATGTALLPVIAAAMLFQGAAQRSLEQVGLAWQESALLRLEDRLAAGDPESAARAVFGEASEGRLRFAILELEGASQDLIDPELFEEVRREARGGARSGDSAALPGDAIFAWRRIEGGRVILSALSPGLLRLDPRQFWIRLGALLVASAAVASGMAWLLARDIGAATEALASQARRLAAGELGGSRGFESEDELGELGRSFEGMERSLRATVGQAAEAADRALATAAEIGAISESVTEVTADQVRGLARATSSMDTIDAQVRGIADSAQALNESVEEASSSVLELGAAGEELNDTASALSSRVAEVSGSIEQMVRSVRSVSENAESLAQAAVETSASMDEIATSMREVDARAEEAAVLSRQVVASAEKGREKVRQTIEGMDAIRDATETAEQVIRSLGRRSKEIGAIVDVIDDVADETNLLALNAAIIAAQAGDHGRAFSVVADEIKDLADRVLVSTKEIGALIRAVQDEAVSAIGAIERGTASVASGVELSAEAGLSLEEITRAARESGTRIGGIVTAVQEQARAAGHVVELMEKVRGGVDQIRSAAVEQDRANEVIYRSSVAMREVAQQVRGTTEEQARGSGRIRQSIEGVRSAVEQIHRALEEQAASCRFALEFLEGVSTRTQSNQEATHRLDGAVKGLRKQAEVLREDLARFTL
jgi:methyl-accepting chemotaxis protein